jgi:hypothetical protein
MATLAFVVDLLALIGVVCTGYPPLRLTFSQKLALAWRRPRRQGPVSVGERQLREIMADFFFKASQEIRLGDIWMIRTGIVALAAAALLSAGLSFAEAFLLP